ncbi:MAG: transcription-repair coupling factor [Bdellovibrionaceae bacterium]|nr:transcription-repair coupling factor [Pseudobdellovibrionaceae bacterium]
MKTEMVHTRLEALLERAFETKTHKIQALGSSSELPLAFFLSQTYSKQINSLPHFVITHSHKSAEQLREFIQFFDPNRICHLFNHFDVSPYSGLYPNARTISDRLRFLFHAQNAKPGEIFISSAQALCQKTLPFRDLKTRTTFWQKGSDVPENIVSFLNDLGYQSAPMVEDLGQYALRGGIIDIFSPAQNQPIRIELFGDQIESLRFFNPDDQRSHEETQNIAIIPARETLFADERHEDLLKDFRVSLSNRVCDKAESEEVLRSLVLKNTFPGLEFLLPYFYKRLESAFEHFNSALNIWVLDPVEISRSSDELLAQLKSEFDLASGSTIRPNYGELFDSYENLKHPEGSREICFSNLEYLKGDSAEELSLRYSASPVVEFSNISRTHAPGSDTWTEAIHTKLSHWRRDGYRIFVGIKNKSQLERLIHLIEKTDFVCARTKSDEYLWDTWLHEQESRQDLIHVIPRYLPESLRLEEEQVLFLREEDFFGKKQRVAEASGALDFQKQAKRLSFGDLKPGDLVVHVKHGIGQYEGLKLMPIGGVDSEFIQVGYKDKDKLYLPVYRVGQLQKYSGANQTAILDKLGGTGWDKTKSKVKSQLRDIAHELLALYAKRAELHRPAFTFNESEYSLFENGFAYEETNDQLRAIRDIKNDLLGTKPMDRLICGDVGFGKTEVAMRAAFFAVQNRKQVAVLAPTTVLTFQHLETFKKRFAGWPIEIHALNRFVSTENAKKTLKACSEGRVDILIGTHRILSKDVVFKDLGLLIIDEEQKFGVAHKEKIKKMRVSVDAITLSATPIPRTLNMSLVGARDLSLINTAPVDRLPTRTFVCKFDEETIRKAITAEISRGGQVYFIHNRIQSIYGLADEIRAIVPQARIRVAHGQMSEDELEKTMLEFFHHEIDVLVCTAIVESGMDIPRANTMFIDSAHMFGLSQLYQLRGRVGRSKARAYCYLMMPRGKKLEKDAQERLKIIQENSALGSGIKIAQYDLELRGSGNILGDDQSGHVNAVGYEMYMDLLQEALAEAKGDAVNDIDLDPEINLRIPAMIPESYIGDIRIRLSYYKALADISSNEELDRIEEELKDQFGEIPEATLNLMGLMLIRRLCKELGVRDVSAGLKSISLIFTEKTLLKPEVAIQLAMRENKKYSLTPDNRLNIRMNSITWTNVHEELEYLLKQL